jgi:hypothetical protein
MKSKRATKETGTRIYCIATAIKASPHEIPIIAFATRTAETRRAVSSLWLLRQVSSVSSRKRRNWVWPEVNGVVCGRKSVAAELHGLSHVNRKIQDCSRVAGSA